MIDVETVWDYELNDIDPHSISSTSNKKFYFKCANGHRYKRSMVSAVYYGLECPDCKRIRLSVASNPKIMRFFKRENNPDIDPEYHFKHEAININWECPKCGYKWTSLLRSIGKGKCPACEVGTAINPYYNDVTTIVPKIKEDFVQEENPDVDLTKLGVGDKKTKINWTCHICGYKWPSTVFARTRRHNYENKINKCPVCGKAKRAVTFDIQYPELISKYNKELNTKPLNEITGNEYHKEFWWNCDMHGPYQQKLSVAIRAIGSKYNGCMKCFNREVDESDSLPNKYPELYQEYAPENSVFNDKEVISPHSHERRFWRCAKCDELYLMSPKTRVAYYVRSKTACPSCKGFKKTKGTYYGEKY